MSANAIATAWVLRHPAKIQIVLGSMNPTRLGEMLDGADIDLDKQDWWTCTWPPATSFREFCWKSEEAAGETGADGGVTVASNVAQSKTKTLRSSFGSATNSAVANPSATAVG